MVTYLKNGSTATIVSGVPCSYGTYETLKIAVEEHASGTVFINGQRVDIKDGYAVIPQQFVGEGVNRIRLRIGDQTFNAESIVKIGSMLHGFKTYGGESSLVGLSAENARLNVKCELLQRDLKSALGKLDELKKALAGHNIFDFS